VSVVQINPAELTLRSPNTILTGTALRYRVPELDGPLSIKAVLSGTALWETRNARHDLGVTSVLVLNKGQRYSLSIDSPTPVETFCLFFAPSFVATARDALTQSDLALLDDPGAREGALEFAEAIQPGASLLPILRRMRHVMRARDDAGALESGFHAAAEAMLMDRVDVRRQLARLPVRRASTREELYRRLQRARALADESVAPLGVAELAGAACLSLHHFHRLFTRTFGATPHQYAVRKRLERAAAQLRVRDDSVLETALALGFESLGSFTSLFRRHYGLPPAAWRKKQD
jgi:AraC family transcriptional regulator